MRPAIEQLVIEQEMNAAGLSIPHDTFVASWIGPSLLMAGSEAQLERWLWPMLKGEVRWSEIRSAGLATPSRQKVSRWYSGSWLRRL